jgi:hypothetical protein
LRISDEHPTQSAGCSNESPVVRPVVSGFIS